METIKTIRIPEEVVNALQAADVEQSARREILVSCIERGVPSDNPALLSYQAEYNEWYKKFNALRTKVEEEFVSPLNSDTQVARSWTLNYNSKELIIRY